MKQSKDYPLGKILHIIDNEAICRPDNAFIAKGARVLMLDQRRIGVLGDPFGPADHPYQAIILEKNVGDEIIGKLALAQLKPKKKRYFKNKKKSRQ